MLSCYYYRLMGTSSAVAWCSSASARVNVRKSLWVLSAGPLCRPYCIACSSPSVQLQYHSDKGRQCAPHYTPREEAENLGVHLLQFSQKIKAL